MKGKASTVKTFCGLPIPMFPKITQKQCNGKPVSTPYTYKLAMQAVSHFQIVHLVYKPGISPATSAKAPSVGADKSAVCLLCFWRAMHLLSQQPHVLEVYFMGFQVLTGLSQKYPNRWHIWQLFLGYFQTACPR